MLDQKGGAKGREKGGEKGIRKVGMTGIGDYAKTQS